MPRILIALPPRGLKRHLSGMVRSCEHLVRTRPNIVWFQVSYGLGAVLLLYRFVAAEPIVLVADVHSKALRRGVRGPARWLFAQLKRAVFRAVDCILVTNERDRALCVRAFGRQAIMLPDPLPTMPRPSVEPSTDAPKIVFICSFAADEPLDLIATLGSRLGGPARVACTGRYEELADARRELLSSAVELTGFLSEDTYWATLMSAAAIIVLTTEPACVPCGAYEALAVGRRPVLLDSHAADAVFADLAIRASADVDELEAAVRRAVAEGRDMSLARRFGSAWDRGWVNARRMLVRAGAIPYAGSSRYDFDAIV